MPKPRAALLPLVFALSLAAPSVVTAADIRVDQLELLTHGQFDSASNSFVAGSRLFFDLSLEGGDKFSGLLKLGFLNNDLENAMTLYNQTDSQTANSSNYLNVINAMMSPQLETVAVTARSVFNLPLDLSYFVGHMDNFCSGDDFVPLFGAAPFATELRGPMIYPNGVGGNSKIWYDGLYAADGTGFRLSTTPRLSGSSAGFLYLYQDLNIGLGTWSGDLRYLINSPSVKAEFFAGATTGASYGIYRGGILFYAKSGDVGEFYAQTGVTRWDSGTNFSVDNLFFLFEPRITLGIVQATATFFYHPGWYLQQDYRNQGEKDALDAAFDLRFGNINKNGLQGGLQTLLAFRPYTINPVVTPSLAIDASPYYSLIMGGMRWDFKLSLRVLPFPSVWYGMFKPYIGLKTSY
jgi:hypothetical protein